MDSLAAFRGTYNEHIINQAQEKRLPISGTFELLPMCNMKCKMCYIEHVPETKLQPIEFWLDLFKQAIGEGLLFPLLTGGEVFVYPRFRELYEQAVKMPVFWVINTNATLLDRETVKWLSRIPPRRLNISLYGASDETYANLCGNPNGFTQVMHAFELLREYGIDFRVHSMMTPENVKDYQRIVDICNQIKAPLSVATYAFPDYRRDNGILNKNNRFTPAEMAKISFHNTKMKYVKDMKTYYQHLEMYYTAIQRPEIYCRFGNNKSVCRSGKCSYWVTWKGTVSGCGMHNQNSVDLHEVSLKEAWKQIVESTEKILLPEECKRCKYRCICPVCEAAAYCETGSMRGRPEYLCEYCREYERLIIEERDSAVGK